MRFLLAIAFVLCHCPSMFPVGRRVELTNEEIAYVVEALRAELSRDVVTDHGQEKINLIIEKLLGAHVIVEGQFVLKEL